MTTLLPRTATLAQRAEQALERLGDHRSLYFEGQWFTSGELHERARRAARGFVRLGVRPDDRVVLFMANCPEVGIAYNALWRAGAVPTPAMFLLTEEELGHVLADSGAVAVVTTREFVAKVQAVAGSLPVVVVGGGGTLDFAELEAQEPLPIAERSPQDIALLMYTGGTTGRSKGVVLTHESLDSASSSVEAVTRESGRTRGLLSLPLAHVYGLLLMLARLHAQHPTQDVLMRWFDPAAFVRLVAEHRVQESAFVPTMLQMLAAQPLEEHDLSSLQFISSGGAPLPVVVADELEGRIPGLEISEGYGCTETSSLISAQPHGARRLGSVGRPVPGAEVRITRPDGSELKRGQDGEICVRGPVVMRGYWRAPEVTQAAFRDGWFRTGDVGHLDEDGYLYVVDRIKDLIIRNGFNVYPRDVEDALLRHPLIAAAAVVGRPDPRVGEEVIAFVQPADGATLTVQQVTEYAKQHVSAAKYPREIHIVDVLPLTSVLKTDRKALRARVQE